jgi:endoglucanase
MKIHLVTLWCLVATVSLGNEASENRDAFHWSRLLKKGVNISCALEAPQEGKWGVVIKEDHLQAIKDAGFSSIRLPVRWNAHAADEAPYTVDPEFFKRVDQVLKWAFDRKLVVVLDWHHYFELMENPNEHRDRFLGIWQQLAEHYRNWPPTLYFEVLNEPSKKLTSELWNTYQNEAIGIIRKTNPTRAIVVSPIKHCHVKELKNLKLPAKDRNLLVTFHVYEPYLFTQQGVKWPGRAKANPVGVKWGSKKEKQGMEAIIAMAAEFAKKTNRPVWMGEFGTNTKTETAERVKWAVYARSQAEAHGIPWAYWSFCSKPYGMYDQGTIRWNQELLNGLFPDK